MITKWLNDYYSLVKESLKNLQDTILLFFADGSLEKWLSFVPSEHVHYSEYSFK